MLNKIYKLKNFAVKMICKHFAVVGGPSTGKTTLIKAMQEKGYKIIHEVSRELILQQKKLGGKIIPSINRDLFQREVQRIQIERRKMNNHGMIFSDTSIACGIAYYFADGLEPPEDIWKNAKAYPYDKIFILDFLPFYEKDELRIEDSKKSMKIHNFLKKAHVKLGHEIVAVPFMSVADRIKFIEDNLNIGAK